MAGLFPGVNEDGFIFFVTHRFSKKEKKWRIARLKKDGKCKEELESQGTLG